MLKSMFLSSVKRDDFAAIETASKTCAPWKSVCVKANKFV